MHLSREHRSNKRDPQVDEPFAPKPILRAWEQVASQIESAILSGQFEPGDKLPTETALSAEFAVSRSTVREALGSLVEKGLINKTGTKGGSVVEHFDHRAIASLLQDRLSSTLRLGQVTYEELNQVRNALEVPSVRAAALDRSEANLDTLKRIVNRESELTVASDEVPELNIRFHVEIASASGNRLMTAFVTALHSVARPLTFIDQSAEVGHQAVRHHIDIVAAIEARDPTLAEERMIDHLAYLGTHTL